MTSRSETVFSDFENTVVVPDLPYREWAKGRSDSLERLEREYRRRIARVRSERSSEAWAQYLEMYAGLLTVEDFREMAATYTLNPRFAQWVRAHRKEHGGRIVRLTILTRGFAQIARLFFERRDVRDALQGLGVEIGQIVGSEAKLRNGIYVSLSSAIYEKRRFVEEGCVMLGDDGEEPEFGGGRHKHFVNLSIWQPESST